MAIFCDHCKKVPVLKDGDFCEECEVVIAESKVDRSYLEKVYMPEDLFVKFSKLVKDIENEKSGAKTAMGKFMKNLKSGFVDRLTGKEINDPTPMVIIPQEKTLDRIEKILNHNLAIYAREKNLDTPEDLDDWTVVDQFGDEWEASLYQYVESVQVMKEDDPISNSTPAPDPGEDDPTPGGSEPPADS